MHLRRFERLRLMLRAGAMNFLPKYKCTFLRGERGNSSGAERREALGNDSADKPARFTNIVARNRSIGARGAPPQSAELEIISAREQRMGAANAGLN